MGGDGAFAVCAAGTVRVRGAPGRGGRHRRRGRLVHDRADRRAVVAGPARRRPACGPGRASTSTRWTGVLRAAALASALTVARAGADLPDRAALRTAADCRGPYWVMRSIWKGSIAFGLVNVPVKVYSATEDHDIKFHQVHAKDNGRIRYKRVCEVCGEVVEYRDIAKAYESDDGQTVIITDEDIATLPEERSREIEVVEFVPADQHRPVDVRQELLPGARLEVVEVLRAAGQDARRDRPGRDRALRAAQQDPAGGVARQGLQQARRDGRSTPCCGPTRSATPTSRCWTRRSRSSPPS